MAITKQKKEEILARLNGIKGDAASIVFVGFNGLTVSEITDVRNTLRGEGVSYFVAKKTLIKRAFDGAFEGEMPRLDGEVAVAYSTDAIAPAQNIKAFAAKYKDHINILGGVFEGTYKDQAAMTEIASIPALPVLRGMFVNVINAPIQGLVLGLNAIAEKRA
ncbi:MAG: 50S ribosomal protein L10 [Patescibacteria group bacterium]